MNLTKKCVRLLWRSNLILWLGSLRPSTQAQTNSWINSDCGKWKRWVVCFVAGSVCWFWLSTAQADVLFSWSYSRFLGFGAGADPNMMHLAVNYAGMGTDWRLFQNQLWTPNDVGTTRTVTAATDPNFNAFVGLLTDGIDQNVGMEDEYYLIVNGARWGWGAAGGSYRAESSTIGDWQGYRIDSISLRLDSMSVISPGSNQSGDGEWTDVTWVATVTANGVAIPEPATISLVVFATAILVTSLRRRCHSKCARV